MTAKSRFVAFVLGQGRRCLLEATPAFAAANYQVGTYGVGAYAHYGAGVTGSVVWYVEGPACSTELSITWAGPGWWVSLDVPGNGSHRFHVWDGVELAQRCLSLLP